MAKTSGNLRSNARNSAPTASQLSQERSAALVEQGKNNLPIRVNQKYWESLSTYEKNYVYERVGNGTDGLQEVKTKLSEAKKQIPEVNKVWGKGFATDKQGNEYQWSGNDSRKWKKI